MDFGIKTPDIVGSYIEGQQAAQDNLYKQALMDAQTRQQEEFAQQQKDKTFQNLMQYNLQPKYDKLMNDPRITQDQLNAQVAQDFQAYPYLRDYLGDDFRILKNEQAFQQVIPINGQEDLNIMLSEGYIDNSHAKLLQNELDQGQMPTVKVMKDFNGQVKVIDVTDERKEAYLKQAKADRDYKIKTSTQAMKLRKEFSDKSVIKDLEVMQAGLSKVNETWELYKSTPNANRNALDNVLIMHFNKMLDADSVVRESEYDRIPDNVPYINKMRSLVDKFNKGGLQMTDADRQDIVEAAKMLLEGQTAIARHTAGVYAKEAELSGIDASRVIGNFEILDDPSLYGIVVKETNKDKPNKLSTTDGNRNVQAEDINQNQETNDDPGGFF